MYETFYNLRAEPFRLSPDHRFCYEHKGYAKARAYMAYAFMRAEGFVMVTGRPGTGKTTLIGDLIESLAKDNVTTANLVCTQLQADDLLKTVAYSFGVEAGGSDKAELLQSLNILFHNWHRDGQRALLIVDEAQDLSTTAMEELRLLTNIQIDGQPLLQIFLLGQPELRDLILSPQMEQVHQRIVAASHLEALELEETEAYVRHRLEAVGWQGDPAISKAIFPLIHKFSEGVPRRINLICSRLFLHGGVEQRHEIGAQDVRLVIGELQGENLAAGSKFTEDDFAVEDEFEEIVFKEEASVAEAPVEARLHAVVNEPFTARDSEPARAAPKHTPDPVVVPVPQPHAPDIPEEPPIAATDIALKGEGDHGAIPEKVEGHHAAISEKADAAPATARLQPAEQAQKRGTGASAILAILIVALCIFLGIFTHRQGMWGDWQNKLQARWDGLIGSLSVLVASDTDTRPIYEIAEPKELDAGGAQQLPAVVVAAPDDSTAGGDSTISAELAAQDDERPPLAEAVLPEEEQIVFVAFAFDSVNISPEAQKALDRVIEMLTESRNRVATITGFADSQGEEAYNLILSRQRASAVEEYIVGNGIEQERLQVAGQGSNYNFTDAEVSRAALDAEDFRIVAIRISSHTGALGNK